MKGKASVKFTIEFVDDLGSKIVQAVVNSLSDYNESIYPEIKASAPIYDGLDPRREKNVLTKYMQMMKRQIRGIPYMTPGIPGATIKDSPEQHAWLAIMSLHYGWNKPFFRRAKNKKTMFFPIKGQPKSLQAGIKIAGLSGTWISTQKVWQPANITKNPWISNVWTRNSERLTSILNYKLGDKMKGKKVIIRV